MRRLIQAVPLLIGISLVLFLIIHLAPGGPLAVYKASPYVRGEDLERLAKNLGLDRPLHEQYFKWLAGVLTGKWGYSYVSGRPVITMIGERVSATLQLMVSAFLLSLIIGIPLGVISAVKQYSAFDYGITVFSFFGMSMPVFWFGLMLMLLFGVKLHWLPTAGMSTIGAGFSLVDRLKHLIMPVTVLALGMTATWSRFVRSSMLEVMRQDYIRTAKAKGLSQAGIISRHALKNAFIPVVTVIAMNIPFLFGGAIMTETIFAWPGMGRLYFESLRRMDYAVLMGVLTITGILVVLFNLIADIVYGFLDPRIRY